MTRLDVITADITTLVVDAIVNAANSSLIPGLGVNGAIHKVAGPALALECLRLGGCATGEAKITGGYGLPAQYVIHTVGPVWNGGERGEPALLAACYANALAMARQNAVRSIAFPAISTGLYRFPPDRAARIAVEAVAKALSGGGPIEAVTFCCFDDASALRHRRALEALDLGVRGESS